MGRLFADSDDDCDTEGYVDADEYFDYDQELSDPEAVYRELGIDLSDWLRDSAD